MTSWRIVLGLLLTAITTICFVSSCGGKDARAPTGIDDNRTVAKKIGPDLPLTGYLFASVSERTLGPFTARRGTGPASSGLIAWVTVAEGSGRRVLAIPIDSRGAPKGGENIIANVSVDTTMLVLRTMRGPAPGFVVAWTSLTDRGKSLWAVAVGDEGLPRAKPVELTRTMDDIVWIDVMPTELGAMVLWAEETRGGDANLVAAPLNTDGKVRGNAVRIARGIVGWHSLELGHGPKTEIGISTVAVPAADPKAPVSPSSKGPLRDVRPGGALSFQRFDADAHAIGASVAITTKPVVSGDVEVARDPRDGKLVFAWTDRASSEEPSVSMALLTLDDKNTVDGPRKVAEARGGASLLGLVTNNTAGTAIMFEAPTRRRGENRRVHVARVLKATSPEGGLVLARKPLSVDIVGRGQPELASTATGYAVLATTPDCELDSPLCVNAQAVATVLRLDAQLAIVQREPLTFQADPATLGWGMTCDGEACFMLAASPGPSGMPSRIRTAAVRPHTAANSPAQSASVKPAIAPPPPAKDGARVTDITAIVSGESIVDIATTHIANNTVVALLGVKSDAAPSTQEVKTATTTLTTRVVDDNGVGAAPSIITTRALAIGGVAIASAEKADDGGAIAWVGRDNGDPEVHVTRIDKRGKKTADIQLTTIKGDATDVTITWAGGGWIVAWVDSRDGNGEVYATKVALDLGRLAKEERITTAPGDATDLVALQRGDMVWLAWADSRESPRDGISDIYISAVKLNNAKRVFEEQRLLATATHSRTPHLAANVNHVHVAWIEEAPLGAETPTMSGYGAFWAKLEANGKLAEKPTRIPLASEIGAATSVAIETTNPPATPGIRAVVARSSIDAISLDAIDLTMSPPRASSLLTLDGPPSLDVALALDGGILYFNDDGPQVSDRRARRARIAWTPIPSKP